MNSNLRNLCRCALFAAVICVCSVITIPISPVPVNLALFGVMLTALLLPLRWTVAAVTVYVALGLAGLPVFAGMQGGLGVLAGPTGGFIIGYIPCVALINLVSGDGKSLIRTAAALTAGCAVCYVCGSLWYAYVTGGDILYSFAVCTLPFLPADAVKAAGALIISRKVKKGLV
ncbi:MAG: biotin transporter BioY [Clostridia bacterium]|nr:biotin transporter BioY [Clostridia bacterium]